MFYDGDLQSGIAKALQEAKLVACFVTDDGEESNIWENVFFQEPETKSALAEQTVFLQLKAGSQEAGYLAAIFPLPKTPTMVLIKNGELKEYIAAGVTKEEFLRRLSIALPPRAPSTFALESTTSQPPVVAPTHTLEPPTSSIPSAASSDAPRGSQPSQAQARLAESLARHEANRKEQQAKEKAKREADAKAQEEKAKREYLAAKAKAEAHPESSNLKKAEDQYAKSQRQRVQDAQKERDRILARVEADKAERRAREVARKARIKAAEEETVKSSLSAGQTSSRVQQSRQSAECAVQVRLFDGSTIRSKFLSTGTLMENVRPWIKETQKDDLAFTFKQVLTPLPNKNISISDESQTLHELGLAPSATLILIPVDEYISSYERGRAIDYLYRIPSYGYSIVVGVFGVVKGVFSGIWGFISADGVEVNSATSSDGREAATARSTAINVRTLGDQRQEGDDQQFYNGNALNFEPRKDDEDEKKDA
ncbi:hypothetical protein BGZ60DRAFT_409242 [Tricladium varicosporioides]|nr:hypothetical protein BGZ60DRAFT_409242 [Hymenoscyphus varicosporioides]